MPIGEKLGTTTITLGAIEKLLALALAVVVPAASCTGGYVLFRQSTIMSLEDQQKKTEKLEIKVDYMEKTISDFRAAQASISQKVDDLKQSVDSIGKKIDHIH